MPADDNGISIPGWDRPKGTIRGVKPDLGQISAHLVR
jgi:hypothetical protein